MESASGAKLPAAWCHSVSQLITPLIEFMIFNDPTSTFPLRPVSSHHDVSVSPPAVETLFFFFLNLRNLVELDRSQIWVAGRFTVRSLIQEPAIKPRRCGGVRPPQPLRRVLAGERFRLFSNLFV